MKLVNLPGTKIWVNPEYVTSVQDEKVLTPEKNINRHDIVGRKRVTVEYEGGAGYRTRTAELLDCTAQEIAELLTSPTVQGPAKKQDTSSLKTSAQETGTKKRVVYVVSLDVPTDFVYVQPSLLDLTGSAMVGWRAFEPLEDNAPISINITHDKTEEICP